MRTDQHKIIIESFDEAFRAFYAPEYYAYVAGGPQTAYCAAMEMTDWDAYGTQQARLVFANLSIEAYWKNLTMQNRMYDMFIFTADWTTDDQGGVLARREDDCPDHLVAVHIARTGYSRFDFYLRDNIDRACREIVVTDTDSHAEYTFSDIRDLSMYESLRSWIEQNRSVSVDGYLQKQALEFIGRAK